MLLDVSSMSHNLTKHILNNTKIPLINIPTGKIHLSIQLAKEYRKT